MEVLLIPLIERIDLENIILCFFVNLLKFRLAMDNVGKDWVLAHWTGSETATPIHKSTIIFPTAENKPAIAKYCGKRYAIRALYWHGKYYKLFITQ